MENRKAGTPNEVLAISKELKPPEQRKHFRLDEALKTITNIISDSPPTNAIEQLLKPLVKGAVETAHAFRADISRDREKIIDRLRPWEARMNRLRDFWRGGMGSRFRRFIDYYHFKKEDLIVHQESGKIIREAEITAATMSKKTGVEVKSSEVLAAATIIHEIQQTNSGRVHIKQVLLELLREDERKALLKTNKTTAEIDKILQDRESALVLRVNEFVHNGIIDPYAPNDSTRLNARLLTRLYQEGDYASALQNSGDRRIRIARKMWTEDSKPFYRVRVWLENEKYDLNLNADIKQQSLEKLAVQINAKRQELIRDHAGKAKTGPLRATFDKILASNYGKKWRGDYDNDRDLAFEVSIDRDENRTLFGQTSGSGKIAAYSFVEENGTVRRMTGFGNHYVKDDDNLELHVAEMARGQNRLIKNYCLENQELAEETIVPEKTISAPTGPGLRLPPDFKHAEKEEEKFVAKDIEYQGVVIPREAISAIEQAASASGVSFGTVMRLAILTTLANLDTPAYARECVLRKNFGTRLAIIPCYSDNINSLSEAFGRYQTEGIMPDKQFFLDLQEFHRERGAAIVDVKNGGSSLYDRLVVELGAVREALTRDIIENIPFESAQSLKAVSSTPVLLSFSRSEKLADGEEELAWLPGFTPALPEGTALSIAGTELATGDMEINFRGERNAMNEWFKTTDATEQNQLFAGIAQNIMNNLAVYGSILATRAAQIPVYIDRKTNKMSILQMQGELPFAIRHLDRAFGNDIEKLFSPFAEWKKLITKRETPVPQTVYDEFIELQHMELFQEPKKGYALRQDPYCMNRGLRAEDGNFLAAVIDGCYARAKEINRNPLDLIFESMFHPRDQTTETRQIFFSLIRDFRLPKKELVEIIMDAFQAVKTK
jgi:hypothetical protein